MIEEYKKIYNLLDFVGSAWFTRLETIQEIIHAPEFRYKREEGADLVLSIFLKSCYWLDSGLFDETYLYQKDNSNLFPIQKIHLKMLDIGSSLIDKGFPLKYYSEEYQKRGPDQLGGYVKTFVEQCHKRYAFLHRKISHKKNNLSNISIQKILD